MSVHDRPRILKADETYTFPRYFDLKFDISDILQELDASFTKGEIDLPVSKSKIERLGDLQARLEEAIKRVSLTSEAARREVLIAPVLLEVSHITEATINIEYTVEVNQYLRGDLDYYLRSQKQMLVVEAKLADLTRGFTQLAVELSRESKIIIAM